MIVFDVDKWHSTLIDSVGTFRILDALATSRDTLVHHIHTDYTFRSFRSMGAENLGATDGLGNELVSEPTTIELKIEQMVLKTKDDLDVEMILRQGHLEALETAFAVLRRQMIVVLGTYIERFIVEFMEASFASHPASMYEYLNDESDRRLHGKVDLNDVLRVDSKDDLLRMLAQKAASIATRGKFETTLNTLEKISKSTIEPTQKAELIKLAKLRNEIVHEASEEEMSALTIGAGHDVAIEFLRTLARIASERGVEHENKVPSW